MKRFVALLCVIALLLSVLCFAGCKKDGDAGENGDSSENGGTPAEGTPDAGNGGDTGNGNTPGSGGGGAGGTDTNDPYHPDLNW